MIIPWIYTLKEDEQLLVEGLTHRKVVNGPGVFLCPPWERARRRKGLTLGPADYVLMRDTLSGVLHNEYGPQMYFTGVNEEMVKRLQVVPLKPNQYMRLLDTTSGTIRVERGECSVYLEPTEKDMDGVQEGINIDENQAVIVVDILTGQRQTITEAQVFIPSPNQEIDRVIKRVRLEDHETVVVKDHQGGFTFHHGSDEQRSFFLDPYSELVQFCWSTGIHKDQRTLKITHIDSRPKFMWYSFEARTQDNVELVMGITFFWQIYDVESMVRATDDTPGDICAHSRSTIIQSISQVPLEKLLADFNSIVHNAVMGSNDPFYGDRGVRLNAVEVRSITCKDPETQGILQEIIREATDRLNRLQKQESENNLRLCQINGAIDAEALRRRLLEAQAENSQLAATTEGEAQAYRVKAFFDGLGDLPQADKEQIFNTLRKGEAIEMLSKGTAQLYYTPADVDLSIETRQPANQTPVKAR